MKSITESLPGCENQEACERIGGCVGSREVGENNQEKLCFFISTFSLEDVRGFYFLVLHPFCFLQ